MTATPPEQPQPQPPIAWQRILPAVGVLLVVLAVTAPLYGYERDELYFRMLPPAWGWVDQPPLTPLIAHGIASVVDTVWALRIPAILLACASVLVAALIAREAGGRALAQGLAAWGSAFGTFTLVFGHSFLTGSIDLVVWPLVLLAAMRAVVRRDGRWWLLAAAVTGVGLSSKLLVAFLVVGIAIGLLLVGRRELRSRWLWAAVGLLVVLALPQLVYQLANGLPQLRMGAALSRDHGATTRLLTIPFLAVLISPLVVPIWVAGLVALARRPSWRPIRFVLVVFLVVVALATASGGQIYYSYGVLVPVFALGCVPTAEWAGTTLRRWMLGGALAVSAVLTSTIALPVVPLGVLGTTPIPAINLAAADQVGWPELAATVDAVGARAGADAIVLTTNYGEAGAVARYSSRFAHRVWSGHNGLQQLPPPPGRPRTVIVVGLQADSLAPNFISCRVAARIDNGVGVDNEEQGAPVALCRGLRVDGAELLRRAAHLD